MPRARMSEVDLTYAERWIALIFGYVLPVLMALLGAAVGEKLISWWRSR